MASRQGRTGTGRDGTDEHGAGRAGGRGEDVAQLQAQLTQAVAGLVTGADWLRALRFAARFRRYSFNNALLIRQAHAVAFARGLVPEPDPTLVASKSRWEALGRQVGDDHPGYQIFAPNTTRGAIRGNDPGTWRPLGRGEKPRPGETVRERLRGMRPALVYDVSQTHGAPIPRRPSPEFPPGAAPEGLWDGLAGQVAARGYRLEPETDPLVLGAAQGETRFGDRVVRLRAGLGDAGRAAVLAHELAHIDLHEPGRDRAPEDGTSASPGQEGRSPHRGIREVEADAVAYLVCAAHGLDLEASTVPYVAGWASTVPGRDAVKVVKSTGKRACRAALAVLSQLDTVQVSDGVPPAPTRRRADRPAAGFRPSAPGLPPAAGPGAGHQPGLGVS